MTMIGVRLYVQKIHGVGYRSEIGNIEASLLGIKILSL